MMPRFAASGSNRYAARVEQESPTHTWKPIEELSDHDLALDLDDIKPLYAAWHAQREKIKASRPESLERFTQRLVRSMSVETGILERVYDLDRGTTEALITHGFVEDLVARSSTNVEPSRLIDILRDQESAVHLVMDCVANSRPLTRGVLHDLHATLMRHQDTTTAMDQFGNRVEIPLLKGAFKRQPNNPRRPDGSIHEYCPPLQVEPEIDRLLAGVAAYQKQDPVIAAAWLHHRFTQIHPYQDGNGRVGRVITTLVLLRAGLLPLVVDRDLRVEYIQTLEDADAGDLSPLARLFARLERAAILQALSVDADVEITRDKTLTSSVIENLAAKFTRRRQKKDAELRRVDRVAFELRQQARRVTERALNALKEPLKDLGEPEIHLINGGPAERNAHWYKFEVIKSAEMSKRFINFDEARLFIKATAKVATQRLVFVVSLHHVGRELTGVMEATAFARLESFEEPDDREFVSHEFFACSLESFVFTWESVASDIAPSFEKWLDAALAVAIQEYGNRL